jgi:hypothetical protein
MFKYICYCPNIVDRYIEGRQHNQNANVRHPRAQVDTRGAQVRHPRGAHVRHPRGAQVRHPCSANVRHPRGARVRHPRGANVRHPRGARKQEDLQESSSVPYQMLDTHEVHVNKKTFKKALLFLIKC